MDFETALLLPQKDDVQYFSIKKPKNESNYNIELEKWRNLHKSSKNRAILFIYNPVENKNLWESWFWMPDLQKQLFKLEISKSSMLFEFLEHTHHHKASNRLRGELLDMLTDENTLLNDDTENILFISNLKSKRTKITHICEKLIEAYHFIGHYPLEQYYRRAVDYFVKEKRKFQNQNSSFDDINNNLSERESSESTEQHDETSVSFFPVTSCSCVKKLNDRINEQEFFLDVLPYLDQVKDLKRSLNSIYNIHWTLCHDHNRQKTFLEDWYKQINQLKEVRPYQKKYLLLLIECDVYFIFKWNEKNLPQITGNAIVMTNIPNSSDYNAYFLKNSFWVEDHRIKGLKSIRIQNTNSTSVSINKKSNFNRVEYEHVLQKVATEMTLNRWYFYGETADGRVIEGFVDQKKELGDIEIYLKDIFPYDFKNKNSEKFTNKEAQILNHLLPIFTKDNRISIQDHFIKSISTVDYEKQCLLNTGIRIYDLRKSDHGINLTKRIKSTIHFKIEWPVSVDLIAPKRKPLSLHLILLLFLSSIQPVHFEDSSPNAR
ncbi:unnamed protein product [Didymodactylos carnosus]|uniref:Uncharacterized protein n=1 Tax=Didymodactylos carnosus TaxID=1234261 RepID=A0A815TFU9_9BILA|nr:unnamed protein product [Didymodactylos carnosus]CAF1507828.1 unnamed protein product [Didymodactylos carnosus]CAF4252083.1 unnamed protein product [Didymodactylos carnosus]CAF4368855.1 unnamed protein product [Didymodactylos carnosus]